MIKGFVYTALLYNILNILSPSLQKCIFKTLDYGIKITSSRLIVWLIPSIMSYDISVVAQFLFLNFIELFYYCQMQKQWLAERKGGGGRNNFDYFFNMCHYIEWENSCAWHRLNIHPCKHSISKTHTHRWAFAVTYSSGLKDPARKTQQSSSRQWVCLSTR